MTREEEGGGKEESRGRGAVDWAEGDAEVHMRGGKE